MKDLNPDFTSFKNLRSCAPSVLAVFHFSSGDVFVSDRRLTPRGGPEFQGLITSWENLPPMDPALFKVGLSEIRIGLANGGVPPFSSRLESCTAEETEVELFLWFDGLDYSKKEPVGRFVITAPVTYSEDSVSLTLVNAFKKRDRLIGRKIGRDDYPGADPDAVGRVENVIYGSPRGVPCPAVVAGAATALVSDISENQAAGIELSLSADGLSFPPSGMLQVDSEKIAYAGISSRVLTGVTRGASGTKAASHRKGAVAFEVRSDFTYLVAGHPVSNIGDVYVGGVRVLSGVTRQTDDGGKAKVVLGSKFLLEKSVSLSVSEGSHSHESPSWTGAGSWTSATRWTAAGSPAWSANQWQNYAFRDSASIVMGTDGNNYRCILAHASSATNRPVTGGGWQTYWALDPSGVSGAAWASGVSYGTGGNYFFITGSGSNYFDIGSIGGTALSPGAYIGTILRTQVENVFQNAVSSYASAPSAGTLDSLCDGDQANFGAIAVSNGYIITGRSFALSDKGTIVGAKLCSAIGHSSYTGIGKTTVNGGVFNGASVQGGGSATSAYKTATTLQKSGAATWSDFSGISLKYTWVSGAGAACWEQWIEVYYVPYGGGTSPASGVALSGNSAADMVVGGTVTCDVDGYADDAGGTYTGTPGAVIKNPADVVRHFLVNYMELPAAEVDSSFEDARDSLSQAIAGGYSFAGVIDRQVGAVAFLEDLSRQSRLKLLHDGYRAKAKFIVNAPASDKTVDGGSVKKFSLSFSPTGKDEIINRLDVHYLRDFVKSPASGNFLGLAGNSALYPALGDTVSVAAHGQCFPRQPFLFGFIRDDAMAYDLRDFYITRYKDRKRRISFSAFLDLFELEEGDVIELDYSSSAVNTAGGRFLIEKAVYLPGSLPRGKADEMIVQAREL